MARPRNPRRKETPAGRKAQPMVAVVGLLLLAGLILYAVRVHLPQWPRLEAAKPAAAGSLFPPASPVAAETEEAEMLTASAMRDFAALRWEEGRASLERALRSATDYAPAKIALATYYTQQRNYAKAVQMATEVLAVHPDDLDALFAKGVAQVGSGAMEDARDTMVSLLAKRPREPKYHYFHALALSGMSRRSQALESLFQVDNEDVKDPQYFRLRAQFLSDDERWAEALPDWDRLLGLRPTDDAAAGMKGVSMAFSGRREEAIPWLQRGLKIEVQDPQVLRDQAAEARKAGDLEGAKKFDAYADQLEAFIKQRDALLAGIAANPRDPDLYCRLGRHYSQNDFVRPSVPVFLRALAIKEDHAPSQKELGNVYLRLHDLDMCFRYYERYLKLVPGDLEVRTIVATQYENLREFPDGLRIMRGFPADMAPDVEYMRMLRRIKRESGIMD